MLDIVIAPTSTLPFPTPWVDILTAGGSFATGGYAGAINNATGNTTVGGRQGWTGNSGGYITTTANLPAAALGQCVFFRWLEGTDASVASAGWWIDNLCVTDDVNLCFAPILPPTIAKSFNPTTITAGGTSTLTLTLTNPNVGAQTANLAAAVIQLTNVSVSDTLPTGMTVAPVPNVSQTCGGSSVVTAAAGGSVITVSGGVLASGASCTVSVNVTATGNGTLTNTTGPVSAQESGAGLTAMAQLTVQTGVVSPAAPTPVATVTPTSTPIPQVVLPVIPQQVQNPGAILAVQGGIGNGTRNNTPVPSRPAAVGPASGIGTSPGAVPVLRPPSTGDAGLQTP